MDQLTIKVMGTEYPLKTTLRVAYEIQKANGHKPYAEIFEGFGSMVLEKQLEMLYISFKLANPDVANTITLTKFCDDMYDNMGLSIIMDKLHNLIDGIMFNGMSPEEEKAARENLAQAASEGANPQKPPKD